MPHAEGTRRKHASRARAQAYQTYAASISRFLTSHSTTRRSRATRAYLYSVHQKRHLSFPHGEFTFYGWPNWAHILIIVARRYRTHGIARCLIRVGWSDPGSLLFSNPAVLSLLLACKCVPLPLTVAAVAVHGGRVQRGRGPRLNAGGRDGPATSLTRLLRTWRYKNFIIRNE